MIWLIMNDIKYLNAETNKEFTALVSSGSFFLQDNEIWLMSRVFPMERLKHYPYVRPPNMAYAENSYPPDWSSWGILRMLWCACQPVSGSRLNPGRIRWANDFFTVGDNVMSLERRPNEGAPNTVVYKCPPQGRHKQSNEPSGFRWVARATAVSLMKMVNGATAFLDR